MDALDTANAPTGIVYVLTNPAMPGIVKIGRTTRGSIDVRLAELYSTGVPVPFECAFAGRVADETRVERAFHLAFGPYRINPKREFFQIDPAQAIALLELMVSEDVTPELRAEADEVDADSRKGANRLKERRPRMNFEDMGIPVGSTLEFAQGDVTCEVTGPRHVSHDGEECSLTALTQRLLGKDYAVQPSPYWSYESRRLSEIYDDTYEAP